MYKENEKSRFAMAKLPLGILFPKSARLCTRRNGTQRNYRHKYKHNKNRSHSEVLRLHTFGNRFLDGFIKLQPVLVCLFQNL